MQKGLPYNGWPAHVRHGRDKHYYHARDNHILKAADSCLACGQQFHGVPVPYHAEEYGPTLEAYWVSCEPLCHRCHAMLHARFVTPNLWKQFLWQIASGFIDSTTYPLGTQIAGLLSKFKNRPDINFVPMPSRVNPYLCSLLLTEYTGPNKVATLLVLDQETGQKIEVPDWTIYGEDLATLSSSERDCLISRGILIEEFLTNKFAIPQSKFGKRRYIRLYTQFETESN